MRIKSVSIRDDEWEAIQELIKEHKEEKLNPHEIIKLALRRFLFPHEEFVPLNGIHAHMVAGVPHTTKTKAPNGEIIETVTGVDPILSFHKDKPGAPDFEKAHRDGQIYIYKTKFELEKEEEEKKAAKSRAILGQLSPRDREILARLPEKDKKELEKLGVKIE